MDAQRGWMRWDGTRGPTRRVTEHHRQRPGEPRAPPAGPLASGEPPRPPRAGGRPAGPAMAQRAGGIGTRAGPSGQKLECHTRPAVNDQRPRPRPTDPELMGLGIVDGIRPGPAQTRPLRRGRSPPPLSTALSRGRPAPRETRRSLGRRPGRDAHGLGSPPPPPRTPRPLTATAEGTRVFVEKPSRFPNSVGGGTRRGPGMGHARRRLTPRRAGAADFCQFIC